MKKEPIVTIYTITRNRADLLPRCMKSILDQTYKNIEYIIIDSASTDNTEDVVKSFNDERIRYIKLEENKTFGACINMAFELATGKYVTELDDDDEYHLDKIEKQVELFETLPEDYGMVYCWMTYYDNVTKNEVRMQKAEFKGSVVEETVEKPTVSGTPSLLVRRDIFKKIGGYKSAEEIGIESDWEFAARVCKHYKVDYVPESLINVYVNHTHQRMSASGYYKDFYERNIKFHKYMLNEFKGVFTDYPDKKVPHLRGIIKGYLALRSVTNVFRYWKELSKIQFDYKDLLRFPYYYMKGSK